MRLFFIEWYGKEFGMIEVVKRLKDQGHEIAYLSGYHLDDELDKKEFPNTIFHEYHDARAGLLAPGVDDSNFPPPSEDLLKQLLDIESAILIMMNKSFEWMPENQKKHLYYRYVQYWDGVIKKYKPEAMICPSAPHTVYDLALYGLAKLYNIKTIIFEQTSVYDRSIVMNDYAVGCPALKQQLEKDKGIVFKVEDLEPDIKKYWEKQMDSTVAPTPLIVKQMLRRYSRFKVLRLKVGAVIKSIIEHQFLDRFLQRLLRWGKGNLAREYDSLAVQPDFSKKYVYVTLHYQPECTTSPLGGIFVDQLLMIEMLSYTLPDGWIIYVKEHPYQWKPRGAIYFSYRYEGFYMAIAKLKNVRLVPLNTDTYTLIRHSTAVASVGGTAPWEGAIRGKPGLVFGYPWYRDCYGIFEVRDVVACRKAFDEIQKGFVVERQNLINYLGSFQKVVLNCFRDAYNSQISPLSVEQNVANFVKLISAELQK